MLRKKIITTWILCIGVMAVIVGCKKGELKNEYILISQYKGIEIRKSESVEVLEEEINVELENILINMEKIEITGRAAKIGDYVTIDFEGRKDDGLPFDGGTGQGSTILLGNAGFVEGFEESIVGRRSGDTFELELTFPDPYVMNPSMAGQSARYVITLHKIGEMAKWSDELVQSMEEIQAQSLEEYKKEIEKKLKEEKESSVKLEQQNTIWDILSENTIVVELPKEEVVKKAEYFENQHKQSAKMYEMEWKDFLEQVLHMDETEFSQKNVKRAEEKVKQELIVKLIAKKERLELSEEEYTKKLEELVLVYQYESLEVMLEIMKEEEARMQVLSNVVGEWLLEKSKQIELEKK